MKIKIDKEGIIQCDKGKGFEAQECQFPFSSQLACRRFCTIKCVKCGGIFSYTDKVGDHFGSIPDVLGRVFIVPGIALKLCNGDFIYCEVENFIDEYKE